MRANTDWFHACKWGVFTHFLGRTTDSPEAWQARVDAFDVPGLVAQLIEVGAPYYGITIGQNSGHYCAPNATYDRLVGHTPSKCSRRDLIAEIADALAPHGIALMAYLPSGAPDQDKVACDKLDWRWGFSGEWGSALTGERLVDFQRNWEAVIREWSLRWGDRVKAWWIDGCYFADQMYRHPDAPNFASFAAALKAGNPDALVAFNPGVFSPVRCHWEGEDYTAGELSGDLVVGGFGFGDNPAYCNFGPYGRFVDGAQFHVLNFLGEWWLHGQPRFPDLLAAGYTQYIVQHGGGVTWDVPITDGGHIPEPFVRQLKVIGEAVKA
jgi:hypothetical protein